MVLRVKLIGSGVAGDAYRVNLPTFGLTHGNVAEGVALITVAPEWIGLTDDDLAKVDGIETTEGPYYPTLPAELLEKVRAYFADKHPTYKFALDLVEA